MTTSVLEKLPEGVEGDHETSSTEVTMARPRAKLSRVQRLSSFLPNIRTNSKSKEEHDTSILRKPAPALYQQNAQHISSGHPTRHPPFPPPAPKVVSANGPQQSNRLRRPESTKALRGVPSSGNPQIATTQQRRPRSSSQLQSPNTNIGHMRALSTPKSPRTVSPYTDDEASGGKTSKRMSWLPVGGRKSRNVSQDLSGVAGSKAWVIMGNGHLDYGLNPLVDGDKVRLGYQAPTYGANRNLGRRTMGSSRESRCIRFSVSY